MEGHQGTEHFSTEHIFSSTPSEVRFIVYSTWIGRDVRMRDSELNLYVCALSSCRYRPQGGIFCLNYLTNILH